ncbi:MAG: hypothetical protein V2I43_05565, partial [Parvularcula sp.]|nr:hypothetical protein [Parvularcula sp.]
MGKRTQLEGNAERSLLLARAMSSTSQTAEKSDLERSVGLMGLSFYGIGTILGAGIFVVIGEVIGEAGA